MSNSSTSRNLAWTYPCDIGVPYEFQKWNGPGVNINLQLTIVREVIKCLTNTVCRMEKNKALTSLPADTKVQSPSRKRTGRPPTKRSLHFSRKESSRHKTDKVRNSPPLAEWTHKKAESVVSRLSSQRSLLPKSRKVNPLKGSSKKWQTWDKVCWKNA